MARKASIRKELRRMKLVAKQRALRVELKQKMYDEKLPEEQREEAQKRFAKLARDGSYVRRTHRCQQCGRPRGVYNKFRLCRVCLRNAMVNGDVPGLIKASW